MEDNTWGEGNESIAKEAINFFGKQFTDPRHHRHFTILNSIPKVITEVFLYTNPSKIFKTN